MTERAVQTIQNAWQTKFRFFTTRRVIQEFAAHGLCVSFVKGARFVILIESIPPTALTPVLPASNPSSSSCATRPQYPSRKPACAACTSSRSSGTARLPSTRRPPRWSTRGCFWRRTRSCSTPRACSLWWARARTRCGGRRRRCSRRSMGSWTRSAPRAASRPSRPSSRATSRR